MLYEPGPLALLDADRVIPPRLTFNFEALATNTASEADGGRARLAELAALMASDLASAPTAGLDGPLAAAAGEHSAQLGGESLTLAHDVYGASVLSEELAFIEWHYPRDGETPHLPAVARDPSNVFNVVESPSAGSPGAPAPPSSGGNGGLPSPPPVPPTGSAPSGTAALLSLYMQQNPNERPRIERFLRDNPDDYDRAPAALNLPGWAEFVARNT